MTKKILIVEDNLQDGKIIQRTLITHGYTNLITALTGEDGIVQAKSEHPDLIILDINLPQMSGVEVNMVLKSDPVTRDIPVLFNTGLLEVGETISGMNRFTSKSPRQEDLLKAVKTILGS